ncbi:MAG: hypothetical protein IT429_07075 [Gemmataceae bacterium]|nr:hypothetical protein [Gemmataceae bacterium]
MNLIFALLWLILGVAGLVGAWLYPESQAFRIGGSGMPIGLLALCFVAYNLVRWYAYRAARRQRQAHAEPPPWRRPRRERDHDLPPDPTFDFTDRASPPKGPDQAAR